MKAKSLVIAAVALAAGSTAFAAEPKSPVPKGNPGSWANSMDYPAAALREEVEGVTRFELAIDATGKPTGCTVTESSGNEALDSTTCALLSQRAEFEPATDSAGKAVPGTWASSVRWEIPTGSQSVPPAHTTSVSYIVDVDGSVRDCKAQVSLSPDLGEQLCASVTAEKFDPPLNESGEPEAVRVIMSSKVEREPVAQ